ncbi:hypothetical protein C0585_01505 [Candidatus Woesearchaeota archaeon]|nr:MAG: hypothetical protein C0585_01505 [Candidatus Woesearchaeota archaeon]
MATIKPFPYERRATYDLGKGYYMESGTERIYHKSSSGIDKLVADFKDMVFPFPKPQKVYVLNID